MADSIRKIEVKNPLTSTSLSIGSSSSVNIINPEFFNKCSPNNSNTTTTEKQSNSSIILSHFKRHFILWGSITAFLLISVIVLVTCLLLLGPQQSPVISSSSQKSPIPPISSDPLLVNTTAGRVQGFYLPFTQAGSFSSSPVNVSAWRGIPFGSPPTGQRRWASPTPPQPWKGIVTADEFELPCVQPLGDPMNTGSEGSEDCLYLNVYTFRPPGSDIQSLLPVLFYIHGGGLMAGWGGEDMTAFVVNGGKLRDSGLVLVQVNYRLNIFGFLANQQLSSTSSAGVSGNYGIQDQVLALRWVQNNIEAFGGDPNCVTIAGQSSGGTSVFALMSSPSAKGLFSSGISLSGSPNITTSLSKADIQNAGVFTNSSCNQYTTGNQQNSTQFVACIRLLTVQQLQNLIPNDWNTPGLWGMPMQKGQNYDAVVIVDGVTVAKSFESALSSDLISVPLLFGNMAYEPDEGPDNDVSNYSAASWHTFLNDSFIQFDQKYQVPTGTTGSSMYKLYENQSAINPQMAYDAIVSDYGLSCASPILAQRALASGSFSSNLYAYVNEWGLSHNYVVPDSNGYISRFAHHDVDLWMITETWSLIGNGSYSPTPRDLLGSRYLQSLWYDFMVLKGNLSKSILFNSWAPVADCDTWPNSCYNIFVIRPPVNITQLPSNTEELLQQVESASMASQVVVNYKSNICNYFSVIGIDQMSYWWCN